MALRSNAPARVSKEPSNLFNLRLTESDKRIIKEAILHEQKRLGGVVSIHTFCIRAVLAAAQEEMRR